MRISDFFKLSLRVIPIFSFAAYTANVNSAVLTFTDVNYGNIPADPPQFRAAIDDLLTTLADEINSRLPAFDPATFLSGSANATVNAGAGTSADYASPFSIGLVGGQVGLSSKFAPGGGVSSLMKNPPDLSKVQGIGAQAGVLLGLNTGTIIGSRKIGPIDLSRTKGFLSFFAFGLDLTNISFDVKHFAAMGQYKLIQEKSVGLGLVKWGGVDLTSGFIFNKMEFLYSKALKDLPSQSITTPIEASANFEGTANLGASVTTFTIPIEVSTSGRLLYFLTPFAGLGVDLTFGSATNNSGLENQTLSISSNTFTGISATPEIDLGGDGSPSFFAMRAFGGLQFEFYALSVNVQVNKALNTGSLGFSAGAKLFF
jgi:hypothetical protein